MIKAIIRRKIASRGEKKNVTMLTKIRIFVLAGKRDLLTLSRCLGLIVREGLLLPLIYLSNTLSVEPHLEHGSLSKPVVFNSFALATGRLVTPQFRHLIKYVPVNSVILLSCLP